MTGAGWGLVVTRARWLISRNEDASKKIFVATEILVFDFKLFIGVRYCDMRWTKYLLVIGFKGSILRLFDYLHVAGLSLGTMIVYIAQNKGAYTKSFDISPKLTRICLTSSVTAND